jgi:hypothetical protein
MSLAQLQRRFLGEIASADTEVQPGSPGMAIYRNAYRARLINALGTSFERSRRWAGEDPFETAACHHILSCPPGSWSLDDYGHTFPEALETLFPDSPELAELAWLEWHMQRAFAAPDLPLLDPAELAGRGLGEQAWAELRFTMAAGFAARPIATNCTALWAMLAQPDAEGFAVKAQEGQCLIIWRRGFSPHFRQVEAVELGALSQLAAGASLGEIADETNAPSLGSWLAQWLQDRLFSAAG